MSSTTAKTKCRKQVVKVFLKRECVRKTTITFVPRSLAGESLLRDLGTRGERDYVATLCTGCVIFERFHVLIPRINLAKQDEGSPYRWTTDYAK